MSKKKEDNINDRDFFKEINKYNKKREELIKEIEQKLSNENLL